MFPLKKDSLARVFFLPVKKQLPQRGSAQLQNLSVGKYGRVLYDPTIVDDDVILSHNDTWSWLVLTLFILKTVKSDS